MLMGEGCTAAPPDRPNTGPLATSFVRMYRRILSPTFHERDKNDSCFSAQADQDFQVESSCVDADITLLFYSGLFCHSHKYARIYSLCFISLLQMQNFYETDSLLYFYLFEKNKIGLTTNNWLYTSEVLKYFMFPNQSYEVEPSFVEPTYFKNATLGPWLLCWLDRKLANLSYSLPYQTSIFQLSQSSTVSNWNIFLEKSHPIQLLA